MRKEISLVLSSGGARGLAHIGAIQALEEKGFKVNAIAGSSIGAAIGGFYSTDKLPKFKEWILSLNKSELFNLFDFTFSTKGFIKGERIVQELYNLLGDEQIENAKIPFTAVATDIQSYEEIWIRRGSLLQAIRASASIPSILMPVRWKDLLLVDGGVVNPAPIEAVKEYNNPLTVLVNINARIPFDESLYPASEKQKESENDIYTQLNAFRKKWAKYYPGNSGEKINQDKLEEISSMGLLNRSIDYMGDRLIELNIARYRPDIVVEVSRDSCNTFDFHKGEILIKAGYDAAINAVEIWEKEQA